jgi:hypothetical protein
MCLPRSARWCHRDEMHQPAAHTATPCLLAHDAGHQCFISAGCFARSCDAMAMRWLEILCHPGRCPSRAPAPARQRHTQTSGGARLQLAQPAASTPTSINSRTLAAVPRGRRSRQAVAGGDGQSRTPTRRAAPARRASRTSGRRPGSSLLGPAGPVLRGPCFARPASRQGGGATRGWLIAGCGLRAAGRHTPMCYSPVCCHLGGGQTLTSLLARVCVCRW